MPRADAQRNVEALVTAAPDRLVWGSDWPHAKSQGQRPRTETLMQLFRQWTPQAVRERIEWHNALRLYSFDTQ